MALLAASIVRLERVVIRPIGAITAIAPLRMGAWRRAAVNGIDVVVIGPIIVPVEPACERRRRIPPAITPAIARPVMAVALVTPVIAFANLPPRLARLSDRSYLVAAANAQRPGNLRSAHWRELAVHAWSRTRSLAVKTAAGR